MTNNKTIPIGKPHLPKIKPLFPMKKLNPPLYVIRKIELKKEQELLATTDLEVAIAYFNRLVRAKVKNLTFTTYE